MQEELVTITNQRQAESGLAALTIHTTVTGAAQAHAAAQASVDTMSHTGTRRLRRRNPHPTLRLPLQAWGENVASSYTTPDNAHRAKPLGFTDNWVGAGAGIFTLLAQDVVVSRL